jgi:hypothetical protein
MSFLFFVVSFIDFCLVCHQKGKRRQAKSEKSRKIFPSSKQKINVQRGRSEKLLVLTPRRLVNLSDLTLKSSWKVFFFDFELGKITSTAREADEITESEKKNKVFRYFYFFFVS